MHTLKTIICFAIATLAFPFGFIWEALIYGFVAGRDSMEKTAKKLVAEMEAKR